MSALVLHAVGSPAFGLLYFSRELSEERKAELSSKTTDALLAFVAAAGENTIGNEVAFALEEVRRRLTPRQCVPRLIETYEANKSGHSRGLIVSFLMGEPRREYDTTGLMPVDLVKTAREFTIKKLERDSFGPREINGVLSGLRMMVSKPYPHFDSTEEQKLKDEGRYPLPLPEGRLDVAKALGRFARTSPQAPVREAAVRNMDSLANSPQFDQHDDEVDQYVRQVLEEISPKETDLKVVRRITNALNAMTERGAAP